MHFFDSKTGLIVGAYGIAFATSDGGKSWYSIMDRIPNPKGHHLYAIADNGASLFIVGEQGGFYRSSNRGATYEGIDLGSKGTLFGVIAEKSGRLLAYGLRGALFVSQDGGSHWGRISMPPVSLTSGIQLDDGRYLLADEAGHILISANPATGFREIQLPQASSVVGVSQTSDRNIVTAGIANMKRVVLENIAKDQVK